MVSWLSVFVRSLRNDQPPPVDYWSARKNAVYLQHVRALVSFIGRDAQSLLDVGSNGCPYLEWFDWIPRRVSLDMKAPYRSPSVDGITADFLTFPLAERFDLCTCLQTLEHIPDAARFARKLLEAAPQVLISVPYLWPHGRTSGHVHDPVDEAKIAQWFGRTPDFGMVSIELRGLQRLICYFDDR